MAKLIVGSNAFDMTNWDLSDIASGTVTSDGASEVDVTGADGYFDYTLTGTGLGSFDVNGFPQSGTITGLTMEHPGKTPLTITGISIDASDFMTFVNGNDPAGLEAAIFSGNDSFFGRAGNDVLEGYGGNDKFNLTKGGNDSAYGGDGNDTFSFGAAFTAADTIDGGAGTDKVSLAGNYSTDVVFTPTTMVNVESMTLGVGYNYNLTLNAATVTASQSMTISASALAAANHLTLDASAVAGDLRLVGGAGDDAITAGTGTTGVSSGAGDDVITFSNWNAGDAVNGGPGDNELVFNGDFSAGVTLTGAQIKNVSDLQLTAGHSYNITLDSTSLIEDISGGALGAGDNMTVDASAVSGAVGFGGGAGTNVIHGNNSGDYYYFTGVGGLDTVTAGTGEDHFYFGTNFTAADSINGGGGSDILMLNESNASYSANLVLGATTMTNIYELEVSANTNVNITTNDATVAAGQTLLVELINTGATQTTVFNGAAETDGSFNIEIDNHVSNVITGGAGNDTFGIYAAGFNSGNRFDGGGGYNILNLGGLPKADATTIRFTDHTLSNIQELDVGSYETIITRDGDVAAGQTLVVKLNGSTFNGSQETDGTFQISGAGGVAYGGAGDDSITLTGSAGRHPTQNYFDGGGGADQLTLNGGDGTFIYSAASDSTGANYDTVSNYDAGAGIDNFRLWFAVTAVDSAVTTGALSTATFDSDLAAAIGSSQLGADHAVVFTPDSGTLAGDHFLIVDANGTAGYQAGQDLVILLHNAYSTAFTTADFTT